MNEPVALRRTALAAIWRYEPLLNETPCDGDKTFFMHSIGYQLMGGWSFHGKHRREQIEQSTVVAGTPGQDYGCKHPGVRCENVCAISLLPGALDDADGPIFGEQVVNGLTLPRLDRALQIDGDDRFESFVFEVFDVVSRASRRDTREHTSFRVQRMKRFIERHAFEEIALADIARCLDLSPFTVIRQFKRATGVTPQRYLSHIRLQRAYELLKGTRLSIADVAARVGIRDRFYFSRWFTKETGVAPSTYREIVT